MISTLPVVSAPPTSPQQPPSAAPEHGEAPHAFARQLQEAQGQDDRSNRPQKATASPTRPARAATPTNSQQARTDQAADAADAACTTGPGTATAEATDTTAATTDTAPAEDSASTDAASSEAGPQDLSALLAQLRGHGPTTPAEPTRRAGTAAQEEEGTEPQARAGTAGPALRNAAPIGAEGAAPRAEAPAASGAKARDAGRATAAGTAFQEQLANTQAQVQPSQDASATPAQAPVLPDGNAFSATLAQAAGTAPSHTAHRGSAAAPAQAQLPAALGSPEFAPQLGAQISTFVRDGVQHAHLHLNPAEMGPVTVQIQLDGQTAQVHLLADQSATRQALEQALPQLAGSLREAGLTLAGGGVFQQPRQGSGDTPGAEGRPGRGRGATAAVGALGAAESGSDTITRSVAAPRRRGVVDLVA